MKAKVRKLRKLRSNKSTANLNQKENEATTPLKPRSCVVKLQRLPFNPLSTCNNNNDALQERCKANNKNGSLNKNTGYNKLLVHKLQANNINLSKSVEATRRNKKTDENNINFDCRQLRGKHLTEILNSGILESIENNTFAKKVDENKSGLTHETCNVNQMRTTSSKATRNQRDNLSSFTNKRCVVQLKRIPVTKKRADLVLEASSNPKSSITKIKNILMEPSTYKTRHCVVRLPKMPISKRNVGISECTRFVSTNLCPTRPEIDDKVRKSFRKLSLTRSFGRTTENKETNNLKNSNVKNVNQEETLKKPTSVKNIHAETSKSIDANNEKNSLVNQETLTKQSERIKHIPKLSLKRKNVITNKNVTGKNVESTQFEPQENSTICFEPVRNSTLLEFGFRKNIRQEKQQDEQTKKKTPFPNFANKSDEIESLLSSLDDEEEIEFNSTKNKRITIDDNQNKHFESKSNISNVNNKTNKFFHHKRDVPENVLKKPSVLKVKNRRTQVTKKQRFDAKPENIYEFLSQSQTSDSDSAKRVDPTADIIKKLIDQGKVQVATTCKGKGRLKFKRNKPLTRNMKKIKQAADEKSKKINNNTKKVTSTEENQDNYSSEEDHNFEDHFEDMEIPRKDIVSNTSNNRKDKSLSIDQGGTFSRLARKVLISQSARSDAQIKNISTLLGMVKKIISTPKNTKITPQQTELEMDLSPISVPSSRPATIPSPWRVNEDAYLPKTFNFSRSSGNLPSFSSDIILSTPRKNKPEITESHQPAAMAERSPTNKKKLVSNMQSSKAPLHDDTQSQIPILNDSSPISSFSSNDSNAENMPPPTCSSKNDSEFDNIFNLKQLPNPRRALNYRSPLKPINILAVEHLLPFKPAIKAVNQKEVTREPIKMSRFEENLSNVSLRGDQQINAKETSERVRNDEEDLYGFEAYLTQTECRSQEDNETSNYDTVTSSQNLTIHEKLQDLRKLKPDENELKKLKENSTYPIKNMALFNYDTSKDDGMRQRGIKEMLCSTMLNTEPSTSKEALRMLHNRNLRDLKRSNFGGDLDQTELFRDCEPETTFNENDAHRTYIRPHKRKRRLNANNYVFFLDSDESGDEDDSHNQQKHNDSRKSNSSSELAPKRKRNRKKPKEDHLLTEFIDEFKEIVKEVNEYEMVVEKSI